MPADYPILFIPCGNGIYRLHMGNKATGTFDFGPASLMECASEFISILQTAAGTESHAG